MFGLRFKCIFIMDFDDYVVRTESQPKPKIIYFM